jgi:hypothetical protein
VVTLLLILHWIRLFPRRFPFHNQSVLGLVLLWMLILILRMLVSDRVPSEMVPASLLVSLVVEPPYCSSDWIFNSNWQMLKIPEPPWVFLELSILWLPSIFLDLFWFRLPWLSAQNI